MNNSDVKNEGKQEKNLVYVPFFTTTWDDKKDAYHYTNLDMTSLQSWLNVHFTHCNTTHAIDVLLNEYQKKVHLDNNQIINSAVVKEAITNLKNQLINTQKDNSEHNENAQNYRVSFQ
ncbi:hypothetical protein [uncultured Legionella sp.]|uniref:hypothetical protein n=1 Tax=uncultured Legionella sp. TaxID=210934 RepID=UPI00261A0722|nr:hypothetical protein [uncultured Legionella sp.]